MDVSLNLAQAIRSALQKATATREETAALIAETVRATLRPGEEETDEQSTGQE